MPAVGNDMQSATVSCDHRDSMARQPMHFMVSPDHSCLPGHFPGRPLVPGVMLIEQVLDAIVSQHGPVSGWRLPQVKFVQPLLPGQRARIELNRLDPAVARWRFRVLRDDAAGPTLLASGEVVAM